MKKFIITIIAIALLATVPMVSARKGAGRHEQGGPGMGRDDEHPLLMAPWEKILEMSDEMKLDKDQLKLIYDVRDKLHESNQTIRKEIDKLRIDMHAVMQSTNAGDVDNALKISGQIHENHGKIRSNMIRAIFELKKILTPEQQEQIREIRENSREMRRDRMDRRENRRQGRMNRSDCRFQDSQEPEPPAE